MDLRLKLHDGHLSAPPHILLLAAAEEREKEDVLAVLGLGLGLVRGLGLNTKQFGSN